MNSCQNKIDPCNESKPHSLTDSKKLKLQAVNIRKNFEQLKVIEDVSLHLREGEIVSLLGLSGSGKSTIFNIISGLLIPDNGKILIDGQDFTGKTGRVSYMYQKDLLLPWKKIIDNVSLPLVLKGDKKKLAREMVSPYFEIFALKGFENSYPSQLSGGMKQRASLLRTYMFSRDIMLLDEPFAGLDAITRFKIQCWLLEVLEKIKSSVLFISHDIEEAIFLSDRIYILSDKPAKVKKEIIVDLPRPRDKKTIGLEKFIRLKGHILNIMDSIDLEEK